MSGKYTEEITGRSIARYTEKYASQVSPLAQKLFAETSAHYEQSRMLSPLFQGALLSMLSKIIRPQCILEFGTFTGFSALCLAEGLGVDGKLVTLDNNPGITEIAQRYFDASRFGQQIQLILGDALLTLEKLDISPDLVYIDAAKNQYIQYYESVLPIMKSGGIILADNVLWKGLVVSEIRDNMTLDLHQFNKHVASDLRTENLILPIYDGVHLIRKC